MRAAARVTLSLGLPRTEVAPPVPFRGRPVPLYPIADHRAPFRHRLSALVPPRPRDEEEEPTRPWWRPSRCDAARPTRPLDRLGEGGIPQLVDAGHVVG